MVSDANACQVFFLDISTIFRPLFASYLPKPANGSSRQGKLGVGKKHLTYQQIFDHISSDIFPNLQMKVHDKKTKHAEKGKTFEESHVFFSQNVSCLKKQEFSAPIRNMFFFSSFVIILDF